ncbi:hypothetical protein F5141DRAFT_1062499 [Pisolithus sp. B1]|nr:hypothetical protein F5141DRAFT_1062499 [Pisolithus sp. B1]
MALESQHCAFAPTNLCWGLGTTHAEGGIRIAATFILSKLLSSGGLGRDPAEATGGMGTATLHMAAILSLCREGMQAGRVGMVALHMATIQSMWGSGALAGGVGMVALRIASILSMEGAVTLPGGVGIITLCMAAIRSMLPPPGGMASILGQWVTSNLFSELEVPFSVGETRGDGYNIDYPQLGWVKAGIFISHLDGRNELSTAVLQTCWMVVRKLVYYYTMCLSAKTLKC